MKIVGITARVDINNEHQERRDCLDQRWLSFLNLCGIQAVILPNNTTSLSLLPKLDGVIFSGGNTLTKYGGSAPERDALEKDILSWATLRSLPIMGVCRGMQVMIDYAGGALIETPSHVNQKHSIKVTTSGTSRMVNSYHAFGSETAPQSYDVCARSEDNILEAIKHKSLPFYGIMWHPEREEKFVQEDIDLFVEMFKHD